MRYARLKPKDSDTFMHVYNRIAGSAGEFPFGPVEADYRFSSFGRWAARGKHPFEAAVQRCLLPSLKALLNVKTLEEVRTEIQKEFARISATDAEQPQEQINTAMAVAAEKERFSTRMDRRVRYWVDGLVIGSELFVRNTMVKARTQCKIRTRRLTRARNAQHKPESIYCFRQLRVLVE